jgi:(E)-4-hydroxy-3-methylbut-2-enyl-diphosphate synthase
VQRGGEVVSDKSKAAEGAEWLRKIEEENAGDLTPERIAAMEAEAAKLADDITAPAKERLSEEASPTAGRRFTRT